MTRQHQSSIWRQQVALASVLCAALVATTATRLQAASADQTQRPVCCSNGPVSNRVPDPVVRESVSVGFKEIGRSADKDVAVGSPSVEAKKTANGMQSASVPSARALVQPEQVPLTERQAAPRALGNQEQQPVAQSTIKPIEKAVTKRAAQKKTRTNRPSAGATKVRNRQRTVGQVRKKAASRGRQPQSTATKAQKKRSAVRPVRKRATTRTHKQLAQRPLTSVSKTKGMAAHATKGQIGNQRKGTVVNRKKTALAKPRIVVKAVEKQGPAKRPVQAKRGQVGVQKQRTTTGQPGPRQSKAPWSVQAKQGRRAVQTRTAAGIKSRSPRVQAKIVPRQVHQRKMVVRSQGAVVTRKPRQSSRGKSTATIQQGAKQAALRRTSNRVRSQQQTISSRKSNARGGQRTSTAQARQQQLAVNQQKTRMVQLNQQAV